jgi:hypothetical protein
VVIAAIFVFILFFSLLFHVIYKAPDKRLEKEQTGQAVEVEPAEIPTRDPSLYCAFSVLPHNCCWYILSVLHLYLDLWLYQRRREASAGSPPFLLSFFSLFLLFSSLSSFLGAHRLGIVSAHPFSSSFSGAFLDSFFYSLPAF